MSDCVCHYSVHKKFWKSSGFECVSATEAAQFVEFGSSFDHLGTAELKLEPFLGGARRVPGIADLDEDVQVGT